MPFIFRNPVFSIDFLSYSSFLLLPVFSFSFFSIDGVFLSAILCLIVFTYKEQVYLSRDLSFFSLAIFCYERPFPVGSLTWRSGDCSALDRRGRETPWGLRRQWLFGARRMWSRISHRSWESSDWWDLKGEGHSRSYGVASERDTCNPGWGNMAAVRTELNTDITTWDGDWVWTGNHVGNQYDVKRIGFVLSTRKAISSSSWDWPVGHH